jgi:hypothetical protein
MPADSRILAKEFDQRYAGMKAVPVDTGLAS